MFSRALQISHLFFSAAPALPQQRPEAPPPAPEPAPPPKKGKGGKLGWVWMLLLGVAVGLGIWQWQSASGDNAASGPAFRTATVTQGELARTLRVGGTVTATEYASIVAPQLRGPRDAGRQSLTLMKLAEPGSFVQAGANVAEFELKWLEDHIDDVDSRLTQDEAQVAQRQAEILTEEETIRQAAVTARAEFEKARLDLRTAEVKSQIEAEVLANLAEEAKATWEQLEQERGLKKEVFAAEERVAEIGVEEETLHLQRHQRDYDKMQVTTPVGGLVVIEPMYKGGGQFQQAAEGDQIYPGARFMQVVNLDNMVLTASLNQVDVQSIRIGQPAQIQLDAYPDLKLNGRVISVGAIASNDGGGRFGRGGSGLYLKTVPVEISIDGADERIIPDLSGSADIRIAKPVEGLVAPREAIRTENGQTFVFVRRGAQFERRDVELGERGATQAVIVSGVEEGDELLLGDPPQA